MNDVVDGGDIETARGDVRRDEDAGRLVAEPVGGGRGAKGAGKGRSGCEAYHHNLRHANNGRAYR